jgi:chaperonin GroES
MKFRPLHDRILVRRVESDERTKGGIIIPDTAKEKPQEGEVIAVGPGARDEQGEIIALDVKPGDACCSANGPAPKSRSTAKTF